jgi:hypothetical protein
MRPALLARVLLIGAIAFALFRTQPVPAAPVQGEVKQTGTGKSWIVTGEWASDRKEAENAALNEAHAQVVAYLKEQKPPLAWTPDVDYVREHCLKDLQEGEAKVDEGVQTEAILVHGHRALLEKRKTKEDLIKVAHRVRLRVVVSDEARKEMLVKNQEYRDQLRHGVAHQRQLWLGKVLVGVFVLLGVLACYIRLDEATKGFYTGWLRLGLAGAAAAVGATLWLVC